jgi:GMP synthase (glutamine-hydrolysing)
MRMRILSIVHQRDAGSGVFARAVAERGDELIEWVPPEQRPPADGFEGVLVFGGAMNVDDEHGWLRGEKQLLRDALAGGTPVLGVCLGAQLLAEATGGGAEPAAEPERGWKSVELLPAAAADPLLGGLPPRFAALEWHGYEMRPPRTAVELAQSAACLQAFRVDAAWGVQFHAEVTQATVEHWVREHDGELDRDAILADTRRKIDGWNALGIGLCRRFLDVCARPTGQIAGPPETSQRQQAP